MAEQCEVSYTEEVGRYTNCLRRGRPVAAIMPDPDPAATEFWWNVYFATADCDQTAERITNPYLNIFRRFIPRIGPLDISPIFAILLLGIVGGIVAESIRG